MIFITGPHNAGKSTIARQLKEFGFHHVETGDIIRARFALENPGISFFDWAEKNNKDHPSYLNDVILEEVERLFEKFKSSPDNDVPDLVITGNRQYDGVEFLTKKIGVRSRGKNIIIYLEAPVDELFRRQLARPDRKIAGMDFAKFKEYLEFDEKMGISTLREHASYIIDTHRDTSEIMMEICNLLRENGYRIERERVREGKFV